MYKSIFEKWYKTISNTWAGARRGKTSGTDFNCHLKYDTVQMLSVLDLLILKDNGL